MIAIEDGTISSKIAKKVFVHLAKNGGGAWIRGKAGLVQISDPAISWFQSSTKYLQITKPLSQTLSGKRNADKAFRIPHESNKRQANHKLPFLNYFNRNWPSWKKLDGQNKTSLWFFYQLPITILALFVFYGKMKSNIIY